MGILLHYLGRPLGEKFREWASYPVAKLHIAAKVCFAKRAKNSDRSSGSDCIHLILLPSAEARGITNQVSSLALIKHQRCQLDCWSTRTRTSTASTRGSAEESIFILVNWYTYLQDVQNIDRQA